MKSLARLLLLGLATSAVLAPSSRAALIAQWDFTPADSSALQSTVGSYAFTETGTGANLTTTYNGGSVSLGSGRELLATGLNSTTLSSAGGLTLWARLRFDAAPGNDSFYFGLVNASTSADWAQMTLSTRSTTSGQAFYGVMSGGASVGNASGFLTTPAVGTYFNVALVFAPGATSSSVTLYLDNVPVARTATGTALQDFTGLALGHLKSAASVPLTFDQVQVYNTALSASEIAAIPEPAVGFLVAGGLGALLLFRRRPSRK